MEAKEIAEKIFHSPCTIREVNNSVIQGERMIKEYAKEKLEEYRMNLWKEIFMDDKIIASLSVNDIKRLRKKIYVFKQSITETPLD